jgi:hypothetical protein
MSQRASRRMMSLGRDSSVPDRETAAVSARNSRSNFPRSASRATCTAWANTVPDSANASGWRQAATCWPVS